MRKVIDNTSPQRPVPKVSKVIEDPVIRRLGEIIQDLGVGIENVRIRRERLAEKSRLDLSDPEE